MTQETSQPVKLLDVSKLKLKIHHTNLFRPNPMGAKLVAWGIQSSLMAVVKTPKGERKELQTNILEIYSTAPMIAPRLMGSIICHENITGIAWIGPDTILTTSKEQTINLYSVRDLRGIHSSITDYGPIESMTYYRNQNILLTGTEYGYVACYKIGPGSGSVIPLSKMVKVNSKIVSVSASIKGKDGTTAPVIPVAESKRSRKRKSFMIDTNEGISEENPLDKLEITLFGATEGNVVAWNFHKTTIIETVHVCDEPHTVNTILSVARGSFLIACDSSGVLSTIDCDSYTSLRTSKVSNSSITTIAASPKEDKLLLSGVDPTIHILKRSSFDKSEYIYFDKTQIHKHQVTAMSFFNRNEFLSCAIDGLMIRFRFSDDSTRFYKYPFLASHLSQRIKFLGHEQLTQNDSSIGIWKLPQIEPSTKKNGEIDDEKLTPVQHILIRSKGFIYSTAFSERWIVCSTNTNCCIFDRSRGNQMIYPSKKLPYCSLLEICDHDRYLVTATGKILNIVDLEKTCEQEDRKGKLTTRLKIVAEHLLKSAVIQLLYMEHLNLLAVLCGLPKFSISFYRIEQGADKNLLRTNIIMFDECRICLMACNKFVASDTNLYVYTTENQIVGLDCLGSSTSAEAFDIIGLPDDARVEGMLVLPDNQCILYDMHQFFRVDMISNSVISTITDYSYIIKMDFMFNQPDQLALAEVLPEDYESTIPKLDTYDFRNTRFGTR